MNENMTNINDLFSKNLKNCRKLKYKTQKEFADVLDLPPTTYGQYENGKRQPEFNTLVQMAKLLNTSVDMLLTNSEHDKYLEVVSRIIGSYIFSSERLEKMPDEETIFNIYASNGTIKLTHKWYAKLLDKLDSQISSFIREEVREEIVSQRLSLDNEAIGAQCILEAKVLCESLHYDYDVVKEVAERMAWGYIPEEKILHVVFKMYFLGLKGTENTDEIADEISSLNEAILEAQDRIMEDDEVIIDSGKWPFNYLEMINEREITRNPIAELYLLKHWGLENADLNELGDPFRAMRCTFHQCGLMQCDEIMEQEDYSLIF